MTSETDAEFLERLEATPRYNPAYRTLDSDRLFDLARRGAGADAAARIEKLEAEVKVWQGHAKTAIWGDSEECKSLSAEVDRLVRSRNKWGQRYNKLLLKIRAGESGETDDPASWQLRMALDDANVKNDEAAARIEQLEAALREVYEEGLVNQGGAYKIGFYKCFKIARHALRIPHMSFDAARAALDAPA